MGEVSNICYIFVMFGTFICHEWFGCKSWLFSQHKRPHVSQKKTLLSTDPTRWTGWRHKRWRLNKVNYIYRKFQHSATQKHNTFIENQVQIALDLFFKNPPQMLYRSICSLNNMYFKRIGPWPILS